VGAELLRMDVGVVEPGKKADLIAMNGNPLVEISALHDVDFVKSSYCCLGQNTNTLKIKTLVINPTQTEGDSQSR